VNQNLARAVGPAIGGLILAATSAGTVFIVNAATFLAVIAVVAVVAAWRSSTRPADALPREHLGEAIRAGGRYVTASPALRVILVRAFIFIFFASAVWALLPLTRPDAAASGIRRIRAAGVDLVKVEAAGYVAGLVGGEGEAAGLAADVGGQFGDLLAELAGQARPGVEDRDHRPRARVVPADLEALVAQGVTDAAVVAGHGQGSARLLGVRGRRSAVPRG
jgi:hypothetical protein